MRGFAVHRYGGNDFKSLAHHWSLISPDDLSVIETVYIPFDESETIQSGSCGRLLCFLTGIGKIVIWNLATEEIIQELGPPCECRLGYVLSIGLGYDAKSVDYKVIRCYVQYPCKKKRRFVPEDYYFDLYSFRSGKWKMLKGPFADFSPLDAVGVYVFGSCYWRASNCVLSFDFVKETFDRFSLPAVSASLGPATCQLAEFYGMLGAVVSANPEFTLFPKMHVKVFVRLDKEWEIVHSVSFDEDVHRSVGFTQDYLFIEAKLNGSGRTSFLMAYNFADRTSKKLNIIDFLAQMNGFSYDNTPDPNPRSVTTITPPSDKEKEKEKLKLKLKPKPFKEEKEEKEVLKQEAAEGERAEGEGEAEAEGAGAKGEGDGDGDGAGAKGEGDGDGEAKHAWDFKLQT